MHSSLIRVVLGLFWVCLALYKTQQAPSMRPGAAYTLGLLGKKNAKIEK